ncbi:MAG: O-antigen ligase family protein [Gemmataceae bacterium]|nr:O-antigen ligase family protein [Gemmataceae bacterium]
MEGIVLFLVGVSPWCFGAVDPTFEYCLVAGIGLLAVLWGVRSVLSREFTWIVCPISLSLFVIFVVGTLQIVSIPSWTLSAVSPAAGSLRAELLPVQPEVLAAGDPAPASPGWPAVSYYPAATKVLLGRILAVLVLFAVIRGNIASTASLKRLSWLCLANGVLLTLFGLWQFAGTAGSPGPHNIVFGYKTLGDAFGPFICRNHFAFYVNMCIGLTLGLLLLAGRSENDKRARRIHKAQALVEQTEEDEGSLSFLSILHSPVQLWLTVCLAVMAAGLVACMSRGGVAALAIAAVVAFVFRGPVKRANRLELLALPLVIGAGLIAWVGIKPLESRLNVFSASNVSDGRLEMWRNMLPIGLAHPITGTGYGTLPYIEPVYRQRNYGADVDYKIDHAHNDYLEAFIEGGILRLLASFAIVWFLARYARKAITKHETRTPARLAFGAFVAIGAVAVHSFFDFGMFTPAVTILATVIAAQLCNTARNDPTEPPDSRSNHAANVSLFGWGGVFGLVGLSAIAVVLVAHGSRLDSTQTLRLRAYQALKGKTPNPDLAIAALTQAIHRSPDDAELRTELGQVYLDSWRAFLDKQGSPDNATPAGHGADRESRQAYDNYIKPALRQMIAGRDLCPLLARPHARLAAWAVDVPGPGPRMAQSDPAAKYWARAIRCAPYDPDLLYYAGQMEFDAGRFDLACDYWRRSLDRRSTHLRAILNAALPRIGPDEVMKRLLPGDPASLLELADLLSVRPDQADAQRRILERTKSLLKEQVLTLDARNSYMLAKCYRLLGEVDPARSSYEQAVLLEPTKHEWHFEYAQFLYSLPGDQYKTRALQALNDTLFYHPNNAAARQLKNAIEKGS